MHAINEAGLLLLVFELLIEYEDPGHILCCFNKMTVFNT